jgi:hypothetical protein
MVNIGCLHNSVVSNNIDYKHEGTSEFHNIHVNPIHTCYEVFS